MNYVWNPSAKERYRIHMLVESGYGDAEIAEDMGVDPLDIERIRPTLNDQKNRWNDSSPSERVNLLSGTNTKEYIKLEGFTWQELPLEIRLSLIS
jgi:hypothetical protein